MRIYLDVCCLNRPFDDQSQIRIKLESEAKLKIQEDVRDGKLQLVWSYILDYENSRNPFQERSIQIDGWKSYAVLDVEENEALLEQGKDLHRDGFSEMDALHIACALIGGCEYFLTTDARILKRKDRIGGIQIVDPIQFVKEHEP